MNSPVYETPGLPALPGGNVVVNNAGTITVNNPALPAGAADITVRNPDGGSITAPAIFTYAPVAGEINYVQRADAAVAHGGSQNPPAPMLNPEAKGDLNVVIIGWADVAATVSGVSDSEGNTYVAALPTLNGNGLSQAIWYAKNILGDGVTPNTITVHFNRSASAPDVRVIEYSGLRYEQSAGRGSGRIRYDRQQPCRYWCLHHHRSGRIGRGWGDSGQPSDRPRSRHQHHLCDDGFHHEW